MQLNAFAILLPLAAVAINAAAMHDAAAAAVDAPIKGYGVYIPEWEVQATPGGETLLLSGTVQEVLAQLHEVNPNYEQSFGLNFTEAAAAAQNEQRGGQQTAASDGGSEVAKRDAFKNARVNCKGFDDADRKRIAEGAAYLTLVPGKPRNGPGPGNCGRVSCSWNSAIWWCNDNSEAKELSSFDDIADGAYHVIRRCYAGHGWALSGQAFHEDNWNVVARWARC